MGLTGHDAEGERGRAKNFMKESVDEGNDLGYNLSVITIKEKQP